MLKKRQRQVVGVLVAASLCLGGYIKVEEGTQATICSAAQFINMTLAGDKASTFLGMMPTIDQMWRLDSKFNDGSQLLQDAESILSSTRNIDAAVLMLSDGLNLLSATLEANKRPSASGADLLHDCRFCKQSADKLAPVTKDVGVSVANALVAARSEVRKKLSGEERRKVQIKLRQMTKPLIEMKKTIRDGFKIILQDGSVTTINEYVRDGDSGIMNIPLAMLGVSFLLFYSALFACCAIFAGLLFSFLERRRDWRLNNENPYNAWVHRCAGCTWCCGFWLAILAFLTGGLLVIVVFPLSNVCLILDDMNGKLLLDMGRALDMDLADDQTNSVITDIMDKCIARGSAQATASLLDLVKTKESDGSHTTIRQLIDNNLKVPLTEVFDGITGAVKTAGSESMLSSMPTITALVELLELANVSSLIFPDADLKNNPDYQAMALDSRNEEGTAQGFFTSMDCEGPLGIKRFVAVLKHYGPEEPGPTCAKHVRCGNSDGCDISDPPPGCKICIAGNKLVSLKRRLLQEDVFRCDVFNDPADSSQECDITSMVWDPGAGKWGCLRDTGETFASTTKEKHCALLDFNDYVRMWGLWLKQLVSQTDTAVTEVMDDINTKLQAAVKEHLLDEIDVLLRAASCSFMGRTYSDIVDGLCYRGVVGLIDIKSSYVWCSIFALIMAVIMFVLWRFALDNASSWDDQKPITETE